MKFKGREGVIRCTKKDDWGGGEWGMEGKGDL